MASYRELASILQALLRAIRGGTAVPQGVLFEKAVKLAKEAEEGKVSEGPWTPFHPAKHLPTSDEGRIATVMRIAGMTREEATNFVEKEQQNLEIYVNSRYQVIKRQINEEMTHLSIKRIDQGPIRAWRDMQRIKNELIGVDCEAIELFPSEKRLVDTANQYHLWALHTPNQTFPIGFTEKLVDYDEEGGGHGQEKKED